MTKQNVDLMPNFPKFRNLVIKPTNDLISQTARISTFASGSFDWSSPANAIKNKYTETLRSLNRLYNALPDPFGHQLVYKENGCEVTSQQLLKSLLRTCNCAPTGGYVEFRPTRFDNLRLENFKKQALKLNADNKFHWKRTCGQARLCPWCHFRYFTELANRLTAYEQPLAAYNVLATIYDNPYDFRKRLQRSLVRTHVVSKYWIDMQPVEDTTNKWNILLIHGGYMHPLPFEDDKIHVELVRFVRGLPVQIVKHWLCVRLQFNWTTLNSIENYIAVLTKTKNRDKLSTNDETKVGAKQLGSVQHGADEFIAETTQTGTTHIRPISGFNLIEKLK